MIGEKVKPMEKLQGCTFSIFGTDNTLHLFMQLSINHLLLDKRDCTYTVFDNHCFRVLFVCKVAVEITERIPHVVALQGSTHFLSPYTLAD